MNTCVARTGIDDGEGREQGDWPDFRVVRSENAHWQIAVLSLEADKWLRNNARSPQYAKTGDLIETDLTGVNTLLHKARSDGLKTEFVGRYYAVKL